ncbi:MAG: hypoxanthine phosphoribosyltransferase [Planctomycetes bacterium]|nr:hypoxanthine phosphoribosyltransferase [Planctomycetota bacterium]
MKVLLSEQQLRDGVARLADQINDHYGGKPLTIIGVLTGSIVLVADLIRQLRMPLRVGVVQASSYRGAATTPGELRIRADMLPDLKGRNVLVVDDIFDTGQTLHGLLAELKTLGPNDLRSAVLLCKEGRQQVAMLPDYVGFTIPDEFVVGYGLDYHDEHRNLPYLAVVEP